MVYIFELSLLLRFYSIGLNIESYLRNILFKLLPFSVKGVESRDLWCNYLNMVFLGVFFSAVCTRSRAGGSRCHISCWVSSLLSNKDGQSVTSLGLMDAIGVVGRQHEMNH